MNLAVHGLEGKIRIGNTFYEDHHQLVGLCDFVMANPPFNVDGVQVAKIKSQVGENQSARLPFGIPGITGKSKGKNGGDGENISNANSLWVQYFYSYLNSTGLAGFVMASSASDSGNKDKDIRQKLVETGHVDVMMSIGPKFFYTRSLPCTLWFYDKDKPENLCDTVLMIDARNVYTVVSARSHVFTDEQLANLSAITWLNRGEQGKFVDLLARYQNKVAQKLANLPDFVKADNETIQKLHNVLIAFGKMTEDTVTVAAVRAKLGEEHGLSDERIADYSLALLNLQTENEQWQPERDSDKLKTNCNYKEAELQSRAELLKFENRQMQFDGMYKAIERQLRSYPDEDIGILVPRTAMVSELRNMFDQTSMAGSVTYHNDDSEEHSFQSGKLIHVIVFKSAKGTEFRAVHLYGLEELQFPQNRRELLFTVITRAKTALTGYYT